MSWAAGRCRGRDCDVNAAWFRLSPLTYIALAALKHLALPPRRHGACAKRQLLELLSLAGRLFRRHARGLALRTNAVDSVRVELTALDTVSPRRFADCLPPVESVALASSLRTE